MTTHPPAQIGRYRIERELGRGTMGVVYEARDNTLGRTVALKTFGAMAAIAPHEREAFEQRFLSEARISAALDDENVVGVYDVGRDFETGLLFMALEFVRGQTLADVLARGPMPWEEASRIVAKVARALQTAHSHHIVHRDIKPANIMLTEAGEPKIMDFGIAKASASQLTVAGQVFGTPAYMSPEQASGEEVDGRSDIFSLGCVLYELVTNVRPFEGATMAATLTRILRDDPSPASSIAKVPRGLDAIISRALRKKREIRYDSAAHMVDDLDRLLEGKPPMHATNLGPLETLEPPGTTKASRPRNSTSNVRLPTYPKGPTARSTPAEARDPETDAAEKKAPTALIIGGAVALMALGGAFFMSRKAEVAPPPAVATTAPLAPSTETPPAGTTSALPIADAPAPAPSTAVLSMQGKAAFARVSLDLRHPFGSASLRIKVDDRVVFANRINGMPIRNQGVTTGYDGRFGTDFEAPPGDRVVQVEVRSEGSEFIESSRVKLRSGESRRLVARVNTDRTMTLAFEP